MNTRDDLIRAVQLADQIACQARNEHASFLLAGLLLALLEGREEELALSCTEALAPAGAGVPELYGARCIKPSRN